MKRNIFQHNGLTFSYLDAEGQGQSLIALHAHWLEAGTFEPLAKALAPEWRVIALDQRGHGYSDHATSYTRDNYLGDLSALYKHLSIETAVLLGNSLGGINAYAYAARHPDSVRALVIEDIGPTVNDDLSFVRDWQGTFPSREALAQKIGQRFLPYLEPSFRQSSEGWRLAFDPEHMLVSQAHSNGDHWAEWLASSCPALVIRGADSRATTEEGLREMVERRAHTSFEQLPGGHVVHTDSPREFVDVLKAFLDRV